MNCRPANRPAVPESAVLKPALVESRPACASHPDAGSHGRALELENAELKRCCRDLEALVAAQSVELAEARATAESAREAKRAILSNLSHEVRTPLNVIQGMTHLLGSCLSDDPSAAERLAMIRDAGHRLLSLFEDLMDLARGESGGLSALCVEFETAVLLEELSARAAERVLAKGLAFSAEWDWLPPRLRGDPGRLRQALGIYLDNALKFTERGSVRLIATVEEEDPREALLRFAVADTGCGVPAQLLPRLFAPFEQADASTTRRHGGAGLGLALARSLAHLMGGETGVEATPGGGSTFWFTARLGVPAAESTPAADLLRDLQSRAGDGSGR